MQAKPTPQTMPDMNADMSPPDMGPKRRASAAGRPEPAEPRRRSKRGARVFLTIYLAAMIGMFALIVHLLQSKGPKDWLMCLPILGVWLFIFVMASKQLIRTFREPAASEKKQRRPGKEEAREAADEALKTDAARRADQEPVPADSEEQLARRAYNLLGLTPEADSTDIKRAYRARLRDNDPAQYRDDQAARRRAEARIRELEGAFRLLGKRHGR